VQNDNVELPFKITKNPATEEAKIGRIVVWFDATLTKGQGPYLYKQAIHGGAIL
jgi:hypothetical protein